MYGWIRYRRRSRGVNQRFVAETIDALQALHRKVWEIEESLQEQHAANRKLEQQTARAEAEASVARLEFRDILREYAATEKPPDGKREQEHRSEKASLESEQSLELLDNLMPVLPFRRPADPTSDRQADAGGSFLRLPATSAAIFLEGGIPASSQRRANRRRDRHGRR